MLSSTMLFTYRSSISPLFLTSFCLVLFSTPHPAPRLTCKHSSSTKILTFVSTLTNKQYPAPLHAEHLSSYKRTVKTVVPLFFHQT